MSNFDSPQNFSSGKSLKIEEYGPLFPIFKSAPMEKLTYVCYETIKNWSSHMVLGGPNVKF